jgi:hypothetical protein
VVPPPHALTLTRPYYPGGSLSGIEVPAGGLAHVGTVTLGQDAGSVTGRLRLEDRDPPHADYAAVVVGLVGTGASANASEDGTFEVTTTLGGRFSVRAVRADYEPVAVPDVVVMPGEHVAVEETLVLRRSRGSIVGEVAIPGEGDLAGVEVIVVGTEHRVITGANGSFRLAEIPTRPATVQLVAQRIGPTTSYVTDRPVTVELEAGRAVDAGTLILSRTGGDFLLVGTIHDPISGADREDARLTRSRWVTLDLSRLNPGAFDRIRRASDPDALEALPFEPFNPGAAVDCQDPEGGRESDPACYELEGEDGEKAIWVALASSETGAEVGPFRGTIVLDTAAPERPPGTPAIEVNEGAAWVGATDDAIARIALAAIDATSRVASMRLWLGEAEIVGTGPDARTVCPTGDDVIVADVPADAFALSALRALPETDGKACFHVLFYDAAGNESAPFTAGIGIDRTLPVFDAFTLEGVLGEPAGQTRGTTVAVGATGTGSGYERLDLLLSEDETLAGALRIERQADATGALVAETFLSLRPGDGPKRVHAVLEDPAGNRSAVRQAEIVLDTVAPSPPVLAIIEHDSRPHNGHTNARTITLDVYLPADARTLRIAGCGRLEEGSTDPDDAIDPFEVIFEAPPSPLESMDCVLPEPPVSGPTSMLVRAHAVDAAGNESAPGVAGVILDTIPPPLPEFAVLPAPGSDTSVPGEVFVSSRILTFTASATSDEVPDQMQLFEGEDPPGTWLPFAGAGTHLLAGEADGPHTVRLRVRDLADNVSDGVAEAPLILVQTTPPVPAFTEAPPAYVGGSPTVTLSLAARTDPHFWRFEILGGPDCATFADCRHPPAGEGPHLVPVALFENATNLLRVRAVDRAGNPSPEALVILTHDGIVPEAPVIVRPDPASDPAEITAASVVSVEIDAIPEMGPSGLSHFEGYVDEAGAACEAASARWVAKAGTNAFVYVLADNRRNVLCLRAVDRAGNVSAPASVAVVHDDRPPRAPVVGTAPVVTSTDAFLYLVDPAPGPVQGLTLASGELLDPGDNLHHFEVIGGPLAQWACLPLVRDPASGAWRGADPCLPYDGRDFFEVPLVRDANNGFRVRAVDAAGNAGDPSVEIAVLERATHRLGDFSSLDVSPRIDGDLVVWHRASATEDEAPGVQIFDLATRVPGLHPPVNVESDGFVAGVDVSGRTVVWYSLFSAGIHHCTVASTHPATCLEAPADVPGTVGPSLPRIGGDFIVHHQDNATALRAYDLESGALITLSEDPAGYAAAAVDGMRFAWVEPDPEDPNAPASRLLIQGVDDAAATLVAVDPAYAGFDHLSVSGDRLVFEAYEGGGTPRILMATAPFTSADAGLLPWSGSRPAVWRSDGATHVVYRAPAFGPRSMGSVVLPDAGVARHDVRELSGAMTSAFDLSFHRLAVALADDLGQRAPHVVEHASMTPVDALGSGHQWQPAVAGERIVWLDGRDGSGGVVMRFDRSTGIRDRLPGDLSGGQKDGLVFDGELLAWQEEGPGDETRVVYGTWSGGRVGEVPEPASGTCACPDAFGCLPKVAGGRIAWHRQEATTGHVCIFDVQAGATTIVSDPAVRATQPALDTATAVWIEDGRDLRRHDLQTGADLGCVVGPAGCTFTDGAAKTSPTVDGGRIAWVQDERIRFLDLDAGMEPALLIAGPAATQSHPHLRGDLVVFLEGNFSRPLARIVELSSGTSRRLMHGPGRQGTFGYALGLATDGRTAVFIDDTSGEYRVFWFRPPGL